MFCLVVTRNGKGEVYKFPDKKAARLHPLTQVYDVVATDAIELAVQYCRADIEILLKFVEGRDKSRLIDLLETWKSEPKSRDMPGEAREILWRVMFAKAKYPPKDAEQLINLIVEDRQAVESGVRSRAYESTQPGEFSPQRKERASMSDEAATKTRKARVSDDAVIKLLVDKNPKREGSKAAERFASYKDGMTVKQAKDAGLTAADLSYDAEHNYISVTEPAAA